MVEHPHNKFQQSVLVQLRIGVLFLAFETGRYYYTPQENCACQICGKNFDEDKFCIKVLEIFLVIAMKYFFNKLSRVLEYN